MLKTNRQPDESGSDSKGLAVFFGHALVGRCRRMGRNRLGVTEVVGDFVEGAPVEVCGPDGVVFAKGLASQSSADARTSIGERAVEAIHRDDLVILPEAAAAV